MASKMLEQAKAKGEAALEQAKVKGEAAMNKAEAMGIPTDQAKVAIEGVAGKAKQAAEKGMEMLGPKLEQATVAFEQLSEMDKERFLEEKSKLMQRAAEKKEEIKAKALELSGPIIDKALDKIKEKVKAGATKDPAMFPWAKRVVGTIVDIVWVDVKLEASEKLKAALLEKEKIDHGSPPCFGGPAWMRAFILYHFLPYDKAIWGQLRDPGWWLLTIITMLPIFAVRTIFFTVLLVCLACPHRPDEFQLVKYVMRFKGSQFITGGFIAGLRGAFEYLNCVTFSNTENAEIMGADLNKLDDDDWKNNYHSCDETGPGTMMGTGVPELVFELVGGIICVWVALFLTQYSVQHKPAFVAERKAAAAAGEAAVDDEDTGARGCCGCGPRRTSDRRTTLIYLLYGDMLAFFIAVAFLYIGSSSSGGLKPSAWQFQTNLYWANVIYSMLAFPFFPFQLPLLNKALTHAEHTGFNVNGVCMPFEVDTSSQRVVPSGAPFAVDAQPMLGYDLEAADAEEGEDCYQYAS